MKILVNLIKPELLITLIDLALSLIETAVKTSSTDWDDKNILPIVTKLRGALNIAKL